MVATAFYFRRFKVNGFMKDCGEEYRLARITPKIDVFGVFHVQCDLRGEGREERAPGRTGKQAIHGSFRAAQRAIEDATRFDAAFVNPPILQEEQGLFGVLQESGSQRAERCLGG